MSEKSSSKASPQKSKIVAKKQGASTPGKARSGARGGDQVAERRNYYQRLLFWAKISASVTGISAVLLVSLGIFSIATSKETHYFQVDHQNRIVSLVPLSQPRHSNAFVADWLNKCMVETFDFYYGNMDRHLNSMNGKCFNDSGFRSLMSGLKDSGNYQAVKDNELFSAFSFDATPVVVKTASDASAPYRWMLQGEGRLTLSTTTRTYPNIAKVTAIVTRSSLLDDNIGLSIEKVLIQTRGIK